MIAWLTSIWAKVMPYLIAALGLAATVLSIRQSGKNAVYSEIDKQKLEQANEVIKITQKVNTMPDAIITDELRQFQRD